MKFALAAAELASNTRAEEIVLLDLRGRSPVTEFFIIATGTSPRQMRTVAEEIQDLGKRMGFKAWQTSGFESARWILVDCVNVVAHIFDGDSRDFYDLELLWGDCPRIDWRKELGLPPEPEGAQRLRTRTRFEQSAGGDEMDAEEEDARLEGRDLDEEEDDADVDEDEELDAPIVMELPDESTGSNSVEFVEVEPPSNRRKRGRTAYPTTIQQEEDAEEEAEVKALNGLGAVEQSSDEDDAERRAEAVADEDVEDVSEEDLPPSKLQTRPMGGVSASMSSTTIEEEDEGQQRGEADLGDGDEISETDEAAAETAGVGKPVDEETGESGGGIPARRPRKSVPKPTRTKPAKAGAAKKSTPKKRVVVRAAAKKAPAKSAKTAKKKSPAKPAAKKSTPKKPAAKAKPKPKAGRKK